MTTPQASRTPRTARYLAPEPAPGVTLAEVLAAIAEANLPPRRRHDMASAVRTLARVLGLSPEQIPALPRLLARRLGEIAPLAHGIEAKRWNNIRSLLRAGLDLMAPIEPGRHLNALSPPWQALWDRIEARQIKIGTSRFMRFCSAQGIAPAAVDATVYERFAASLDNSLLKSPADALQITRSAWAKARGEVPGWPDVGLPKPPPRAGRYSLPWSAFPESLQQDLKAWLDHLRGDDLLDGAAHRPLRPESLHNREYHLRAFASALVQRGRDPASLRSLADLVEIETLKEGIRFYLKRNGGQSNAALAGRAAALVSLAHHWVYRDAPHPQKAAKIEAIKKITNRLSVEREGLTERNLARLRQFDDPANVEALLNLPERLFAKAEQMRHGQRAAVLVQTAVAIAILLFAPMRIRNLSMIDINQHLVRPGRKRGVLLIVFERSEVKNRQWLDYPVPEDCIVWLERYLAEYRPLLAPPGNTALFPGKGSGPKGRAVLGPRISRVVFQHTGLRVNPHLFRHIAAKLQLDAEPGSYELVRRLLGHRSIETTTGFYTGLETAAAARHYDRTRQRLRDRRR